MATPDYELEEMHPTSTTAEARNLARPVYARRASLFHFGTVGWIMEIFGCTLSILTITTTILVLQHYDGHTMPVVLPHNIKLGSVLSVFATVIKGALWLPLAAGLSQIIWSKLRQGSRSLDDIALFDQASRGVTGGITLLWNLRGNWVSALGVFCGILAFTIGPTIQGTLGSKYTTGNSTLPICVHTNNSQLGTLFNQYQASVFLSNFNPAGSSDESLQSLNTNCVTGDCTWPIFASLAVCSNTTDLYDQTTREYNSDGSFASLTLPNGLSLSDIGSAEIYWNGSTTFPTINYNDWSYQPIARFSLLFYHYDSLNRGFADYRAAEGVMYWCVQSYDSSVTSNTLSSTIKSTWYPPYLNNSASSLVLTPPQETWKDLGLAQPTDFIMDGSDTLRGMEFIDLSVDINNTSYDPPNQLENIAGLAVDNFPEFFAYLASAMTNRLRGKICNETVEGKMNQEQVLKVDWAWLALPSATIVLVSIFLAAVISESQIHGVDAWKSNILAVLFHGLSDEVRLEHEVGKLGSVRVMEEKAKGIVVQLREGDVDESAGLLLRC